MSKNFERTQSKNKTIMKNDMDQGDYRRMVKQQMEIDSEKNRAARRAFDRPPYCIGEYGRQYREWEQMKESRDTTD